MKLLQMVIPTHSECYLHCLYKKISDSLYLYTDLSYPLCSALPQCPLWHNGGQRSLRLYEMFIWGCEQVGV